MSTIPITDEAYNSASSEADKVDALLKCSETLELENARLRITPQKLAEALVAAEIIHPLAIEAPGLHDNYRTMERIIKAAGILRKGQDR
jgi:hypothetical protein